MFLDGKHCPIIDFDNVDSVNNFVFEVDIMINTHNMKLQ